MLRRERRVGIVPALAASGWLCPVKGVVCWVMKEKWRKTPADGSRHSFSVLRPECFFFLFTSPRRCTPQCTPVPRKKAGKKYNCPISLRISERRGFGGGVPKRNHCAGAPDKNKKFCFPAEAEPLFPRAWYNSAGKRNWEPPRGREPKAKAQEGPSQLFRPRLFPFFSRAALK